MDWLTSRVAHVLPIACSVLMLPSCSWWEPRENRETDIIQVAPPSGTAQVDRAAIIAALEQAEAGAMVRFASGTYGTGEIIAVPQAGITLEGHPDGTTLRGCHPREFPRDQEWAQAMAAGEIGQEEVDRIVRRCGIMVLTGGRVTIRGFTFEYTRSGICITLCSGPPVADTVGGYRIEGNTFRNSSNGVRGRAVSSDTSVIRNNRFVNTFHAVSLGDVSNFQIVDNEITAPEPGAEPAIGHVTFAIAVAGGPNLIARNSISGHPDGIILAAFPGSTTSGNVIRENTIKVARNRLPEGGTPNLASSDASDSTIVGIPLAVRTFVLPGLSEEPSRLYDNLIEANRILGAEGIGIELTQASGNRIIGNRVIRIALRQPFPGNVAVPANPDPWRMANGAGIWISRGSDENEIVGNTFEDVATYAIVLEGDRNIVSTRAAREAVQDLGTGNRVSPPNGR